MDPSITTKDIAQMAGVNQSTVSRALRDDPRLPVSRRHSIQELAQKMGYLPNASARALSVIRRSKRADSQQGTLALLIPYVAPTDGALHKLVEFTRAHSLKLGYKLDLLHFHAPGLTGQQLTRILRTRGIAGIMVLPDFASTRMLKRLQIDWSYFPAITLGNALLWPPLHRVSDNHFGNAKRAVRELARLGYRRIGLCVDSEAATIHADGGWEGGYRVGTERLGNTHPPFYYKSKLPSRDLLHDWVRQEKLDAILADSLRCATGITHSGFKVPEKLGIASLMSSPDWPTSGIDPNHPRVWTMAVDFLVHLIQSQQRGIPEFPQRLLLDGTWIPGQTLRRINHSAVSQ